MLFHTKKGYVERGHEDDIVKSSFCAGRQYHFHAADAFDRESCQTVAEGNKRCRIGKRAHGLKKVSCVDHVVIGTAIDNKCGGGAFAGPMNH